MLKTALRQKIAAFLVLGMIFSCISIEAYAEEMLQQEETTEQLRQAFDVMLVRNGIEPVKYRDLDITKDIQGIEPGMFPNFEEYVSKIERVINAKGTSVLDDALAQSKTENFVGFEEGLEFDTPRGVLEIDEMTAERNYTDRFIVKYKPNKQNKSDKLEKVSKKAFNSAKTKKEDKRLERASKRVENHDESFKNIFSNNIASEKPEIELLNLIVKETDYHIISLNEAIDPDEFIASVGLELGNDIEYIQPDYKLELSGNTNTVVIDFGEDKPEVEGLDDNSATEDTVNEDSNSEPSIDLEINEVVIETAEFEKTKENTSEKTITDIDLYDVDANLALAHQKSTGTGVIVAIIDTGIDVTHPELSANMISGWDFFNDTSNVYNPDLGMEQAHGTHIAGIISSVAPDVKIMPLKVFENGVAYTSDIIEAIQYAEANGAKIVNCSWGCTEYNQALKEVMEQSGMFFVTAVGNNRLNVEETPIYPASYGLDNIISVTAFNNDFGLSYFSNFGTGSVDIAAWGRDVYSTFPNGEYGTMNGTSMAAGYVTGAAVLVSAQAIDDIKEQLKSTSDKLSCLQTKVDGGNKINFSNAVNSIANSAIIDVYPDDDFDAQGYQPTPQESWELFSSLENVQVTVGDYHSMVLKSNGTIWSWGRNNYGQLGDGTTVTRTLPIQVIGLTSVIQIASGAYHNLALTDGGTVLSWGDNSWGKLGDGTTAIRTTPVQVSSLSGIEQVAAGDSHSIALMNDGTVWTWGYNNYGQLGDDSTYYRVNPNRVLGQINDFHGNGFDDAFEISDKCIIEAYIDYSGDNDYFVFTASVSGDYVLYTTSNIDTYGYLYGPNPTSDNDYLTYNDDGGENLNFRITYNLVAGTKYYVRIRHFSPLKTGYYKLIIENTPNNFHITLNAENVTNTSDLAFVMTYDPSQVQLVDLIAQTYARETLAGNYEMINFTSVSAGNVCFTMPSKNLQTGELWNGTLNIFAFELDPAFNGTPTINITRLQN